MSLVDFFSAQYVNVTETVKLRRVRGKVIIKRTDILTLQTFLYAVAVFRLQRTHYTNCDMKLKDKCIV